MKTEQPQAIHLKDYVEPAYLVEDVQLVFDLEPSNTRVLCATTYYANNTDDAPLVLDGEDLNLLNVTIDGRTLDESEYVIADNTMT